MTLVVSVTVRPGGREAFLEATADACVEAQVNTVTSVVVGG